jgi:hypothetical protein
MKESLICPMLKHLFFPYSLGGNYFNEIFRYLDLTLSIMKFCQLVSYLWINKISLMLKTIQLKADLKEILLNLL